MQVTGNITLVTQIGKFEFDAGTIMSHAKLVRDTIMGQVMDGQRIIPRAAQKWIRENLEGPAKYTQFQWNVN